jgi:probable rRNA maturation factor
MPKHRLSIACLGKRVPVNKAKMRKIVHVVLDAEEIVEWEISLVFGDNPTIHRLNIAYLDHDEPTDVLSFPLSEPGSKKLVGELIIGAETAQIEAAARGHDLHAELALYVIHGLLHLCGYEDQSIAAIRRIRRRERHYLKTLGLPNIAPK